jgi:hypothetical protein
VLVVTADHGISFTPGQPVRGLQASPQVPASDYSQLLYAPLFVKASGQETGEVDDSNVMSIDVVPTIAKLTGFELPWKVDGVVAGTRKDPEKLFMKATLDEDGTRIAPPIRFDGGPTFRQMLAENVDAITLPGDEALRLYRMKPVGALVGKDVATLTMGDRAGTGVIQDLKPFRKVDRAKELPVFVTGITSKDATIAIAVNGVIGGVSPTFANESFPHFYAAILPDSLLHQGANDVRFYTVTGPDSAPVLHPMGVLQP